MNTIGKDAHKVHNYMKCTFWNDNVGVIYFQFPMVLESTRIKMAGIYFQGLMILKSIYTMSSVKTWTGSGDVVLESMSCT